MDLRTGCLADWLTAELSASSVSIDAATLLGGGAIQENWALDLQINGGPRAGRHQLVLRTDAASGVAVSWSKLEEFRFLQVAHKAGVTVPEPWLACDDSGVIGKPFCLMQRLQGEARGHKLVRDPGIAAWGEALAERLGRELAKLHKIRPPLDELAFAAQPRASVAQARVAEYRGYLDVMGERQLVLEWALRLLEINAPLTEQIVLCHGDYRTGNYLVDDGRLQGILDWEFACWSDPLEDLGWMLGRYWRFGAYQREVGGIGSLDALLAGYEAEGGCTVDRELLPYWEMMGTVRWAVIALQQARRHFDGGERSLALAVTAHVVPVLERDLLDLGVRMQGA